MSKRFFITVAALLLSLSLCAASNDPISFKGGFTRAVMKEGKETIMLTQGAVVEIGSVHFEAETIELVGPASRYIIGTDAVRLVDSENGITISSNTLSFDRESDQLLVDGWVEVQDLTNEIIATGAYLSYNRSEEEIKLQIAAKLLRHTDSGPMVCRADSIEYDRLNKRLSLIGNVFIEWKGDLYQASTTIINLETDEIEMKGAIKGRVNG